MELCNYCGYERKNEYKFCPLCGNSFENICSNCFSIVEPDKYNYCPYCSNQIREILLFFSIDEITHSIEEKAIKDVEDKLFEFEKLHKNFVESDIKLKFNSLREFKLINYKQDKQISFLVDYFIPDGLQIYLNENCENNYEIYNNIIIFSKSFYLMLDGVQRRWWIGHLIGHIIRRHYYYKAVKQKIENELTKYPFIIRTHRTYIVNIKNISHTKGNARNYQLYFSKTELSVPVARSRFEKFNEVLTANS